jgi:23S rRNA pseudouridine2605 synthase
LDRPPTGDGLPGGVEGSALRLSLHEGRKRIVRRMCAAVGFELTHLHRTRIGPLRLGAVETGRWRDLSKDEIAQLNASVDLDRGDDR